MLYEVQETQFNPWVGNIPWRRKQETTSVFLPGKSQGRRSLVGYSLWGHKESDTTEHTHTLFMNTILISPKHTQMRNSLTIPKLLY